MVTSTGTFVSCKDYDDDIDEINGKIDKIETTLSELESKIGDKGVSSVTFDEKTGVLTVVDGTGSHTYTIKTTAPSVEKTVVTVDGKDLKVDGKVIGQLGDTVEVKDNELYVNGKATGIKVGKYAILENDADGMYTITLPDANGEMKTIKLPKATSGMMNVTANVAKFTAKNTVTPSTAPDGIAWGKADKAITWKGAKGNIAKGQLLLGRYTEGEVTVVPSSYNLGAQTLKLVASDGSVAPVTVTATANNDLIYGDRAASANGNWTVAITMDETVTADNIATAFATEVESQAKNVKYALSVNGDLVTGYEFVIDTDETAETTALEATKIKVGGVNGTDDAKNASGTALDISDFKLGTNEIIIEDKDKNNADAHKVYDAYLEIGDIDKAGRYGVTVNGMKITAADKAAKQEIPFIVHILDVTGAETKQYINVTFVAATVEDEPIADQTYKLMPEKNFVIDLGNTFTGLTDEQADKVQGNITWATDGNFFKEDITESNVTYYTDAACKKQVTDLSSAATIKTIKYAKIADSEIADAPKAGATKLTITLSDAAAAGNEIKKVSANYTITLPSFDELAVVNTNALWNEAGTTLTARMGWSTNATLSLAKAYTVKDGVKGLTIDEIEYVATYTTDDGDVTELTVTDGEIENASGLIDDNKVKYNTLAATASIELATDLTVSKDFTVTVKSIFEDAKIVYYKAGAAQSIATVGADNYIAPLTGAADKRTGLALVFNGKEIAVAGTDMAIDGITLTTNDPSSATEVKVEYDNTEASKGTVVAPKGTAADKDAKGVSITDMKSGEKGTLVVTFTDKNGVVTTSTIDYQYN